MKFTKVRPTRVGEQYVVIWYYQDSIWCDSILITEDGLEVYSEEEDAFIIINYKPCWEKEGTVVKYIIKKGNK